jgi:hypothetical protein
MKINTLLGIAAGKSSQFILKKLGRGTTLSGNNSHQTLSSIERRNPTLD